MPCFAEFAPTTYTGNSQDSAVSLEEGHDGHREEGINGDREPSIPCRSVKKKRRYAERDRVTVLYGWRSSVRRRILVPYDEHWDFRAVFTCVPDLAFHQYLNDNAIAHKDRLAQHENLSDRDQPLLLSYT